MKLFRSLVALLGLLALAPSSQAQTSCAPTISQTTTSLPLYSGSIAGPMARPSGGQYVYVMTQYGIARGSLANPASPGPFVLAQIGHKSVNGVDNGGKVPSTPALCDCWQGGTTIDAAEAPDGSARMVTDFDPRFGGLPADVAVADSGNGVAFGQQINTSGAQVLGARVAAIFLPSGKYVGYFAYAASTGGGGVAVVDVTTTSGSPAGGSALQPLTTISWGNGSAVILKTAAVGGKYLLAGVVNSDHLIRIAEIDTTTGIPVEKASASTAAAPTSIEIASVNGRTFVFSAEGAQGVRVYEYTASALTLAATLTGGNYNRVVVTGGTFPVLFAHNIVSSLESYIEMYDTNWITQGGFPRHGAHLRHYGAPQSFFGPGDFQASVVGNNAYVYRVQSSGGTGEALVSAFGLDISCISIDPSSPPIVNSVASNLSAALRQGAERTINYYGDQWEIQDASASSNSPPANGLDQIEWDWNYSGAFAPDTGWSLLPYSAANSDVRPAYFPCNPTAGGDIRAGTNCSASLGNPAVGGSYQYALRTHNGNGWGTPGASGAIAVAFPQARIAGFSGGVLQVLTGQGVADASGSQGNVSQAAFAWTFTPSGAASTAIATVPATATAFSLTITYPGGYRATQSGSIVQVDLVPDFSPSTATLTVGGQLTITNTMQKAAIVALTLVEYSWDGGAFVALPASFNVVGGTASVPAPAVGPGHNLTLRFTKTTAPTQMTVTHGPFNVTNSLAVSVSGPTSGSVGQTVAFTANVAGGAVPYSYAWRCGDNALAGYSPGAQTQSCTYTSARTYTVQVKITDAFGSTGFGSAAIVISGGGGCTSNCGGGGTLSVSVTGPSTGATGTPVSFSTFASGGTPPYSYSYRCGDNALAGYTSGQNFSCTYGSAANYTVSVRVSDAASSLGTASRSVSIRQGGKPLPSTSFTVNSGASINPFNGVWEADAGTPITMTADEAHATTYSWSFGDGNTALGRVVTHTFGTAGSYNINLTVTGDGGTTAGTATGGKKFLMDVPKFAAVVVRDVAHAAVAGGTWLTDVTVSNTGQTELTITPLYVSYETLLAAPGPAIDVQTLGFATAPTITVPAGGSRSGTDVVGFLGGTGKGNLFIKYEGGPAPLVSARVYFAPSDPTLGSYGAELNAFTIGPSGQTGLQAIRAASPQTVLGLVSNDRFRFTAKLYNSSAAAAWFDLSAYDREGHLVTLTDPGFSTCSLGTDQVLKCGIGPYQGLDLKDETLGLTDPTKAYVLRAQPETTGATLIASAAVIDRTTNDQFQVSDDAPPPSVEGNNVVYYVPGVSRIDTGSAHWRTRVALLNSGSAERGVLIEYLYSVGGMGPGKVVQNFVVLGPGEMVFAEDIANAFPGASDMTADAGTAGLLRISHPVDSDSETNPVLVAARNYDDRSASGGGTAGTAIAVFAVPDAVGPGGGSLWIPGAVQNDAFRTNVGFFALDDVVTRVKVTAIDKSGNEVGYRDDIALNIDGAHFAQIGLTAIPNVPTDPVTLRIEVAEGGRVGAYATNVDLTSLDTAQIKAIPSD
ncbi:MAG TPA: PKD domain-containing protein [Thermoanaerobaculia bacterium]|nr:PKD domain-containing protein [Thermoanaerobaculia bacterium]